MWQPRWTPAVSEGFSCHRSRLVLRTRTCRAVAWAADTSPGGASAKASSHQQLPGRRPCLVEVPRKRVAAPAQVDDRADVVFGDEAVQRLSGGLRTAVDAAGRYGVEVGAQQDAVGFDAHGQQDQGGAAQEEPVQT